MLVLILYHRVFLCCFVVRLDCSCGGGCALENAATERIRFHIFLGEFL
jgi:hypothetical protein